MADTVKNRQPGVTLRRRSHLERIAYVDGFEAGAKAALQEVRRLNFSEVADRAQPHVTLLLDLVTTTIDETEIGS